ncbi:MAG: pyridoxine 5'-phosphate synthase, partial [Flavobacteriales bacterium]|nr:pyridoxine 5'-phosphate synthase [Flavobacteriales bacterium]
LVLEVRPTQVTLVPDPPESLTSNAGWDTKKFSDFLKEIVLEFKSAGIRTSLFLDPNPDMIESAFQTGTDRIELYTEMYATDYQAHREQAIKPYKATAKKAAEMGLGINAGHDLNLINLSFFAKQIPSLQEVSIGHALIADALYLGLENTIQAYKRQLLA